MVNQNILNYLRENKDKFPQEVLRKKLVETGYPLNQIEEGIKIVYEGTPIPPVPPMPQRTDFWDFKSIKIYTNFGEKLLDFLAGFFAPIIIGWAISFLFGILRFFIYYPFGGLSWIFYLGILIAQIFGIFYFWKKRHYFARGLLFCLILLPILIIIGLFLLFFGLGVLWYH